METVVKRAWGRFGRQEKLLLAAQSMRSDMFKTLKAAGARFSGETGEIVESGSG